MGFGAAIYWTSPAVPHLTRIDSRIFLSNEEASWVIFLFTAGGFLSIPFFTMVINRIGRRSTMLLCAIPQVLSWLLFYYASNTYHIYLGRMLSGIGYTAGYQTEIIYVGEIADKEVRGLLVAIGRISFSLGSLITVMFGGLISYDNMNLLLLLIPLLFLSTFSFMPESPYFYLKVDREEDAFQSLAKLRGSRDMKALQLEIDSIKKGMFQRKLSQKNSLIELFGTRKNRRALLIGFLSCMSVNLSGTFSISANMQAIVSYSGSDLRPEIATIIVMLVVLISTIFIAPMPDYFGRRILTLWFGIFTALGSAILGVFFYYRDHHKDVDISSISWISLVALAVYLVSSNPGLLCIFNILMAELFSLEVKNSAIAIIFSISYTLVFFLKLGFDHAFEFFKIHGIFWMFSAVTLVITSFTFSIMPETKGKTLVGIQKML